MKVGIIGLGAMGRGMAGSLLAAGFEVAGHDPAVSEMFPEHGDAFTLVPSACDLWAGCEAIILSLPTAAVVEAVIGDMLGAAKSGVTIIDTTTSHPDTSVKVAGLLAARGVAYIDAPVSGGPSAAATGSLGMVLGGSEDDIAGVAPVLDAITRIRTHVGGVGAGHALKIINNALCAANLVLGAEAVKLGQAYGLDPQNVITGVNSGSGRSGVTEVNFPRWILSGDFDSGFTMKLMRKDVRLARDLIAEAGLSLSMMGATVAAWDASEPALADGEDFNRIVATVLED
ncbi:NAD(P)-dependent oxidoreductase [Novosphingobium sp. 9]|uniref:NAD(P)-dependent oxidoreductase n=1 Tax=Novosphingobium sp. 9 TaxID=2025349 RepID=UPI0021B5B578|nr:NAD(P)-dependent oxidoreductase [Novosphingobium sp. 9]